MGGLKKAIGPNKNKKKNFVTHLITMPQADGKKATNLEKKKSSTVFKPSKGL